MFFLNTIFLLNTLYTSSTQALSHTTGSPNFSIPKVVMNSSYGSMDHSNNSANKSTNNSESIFKHVHSRDIEAVHKQFQEDGKYPITQTNGAFITTAFLGIPLFLSLLPITVAYQVGKSIWPTSSNDDVESDPSLASSEETIGETFPEISEITPKSDRKYDVVLLGCTGFTGRLAAIHLAKTYKGKCEAFKMH